MKNVIRRLLILLVIASLIPSCNLLEDCKTCKLETNDNGDVSYGTGVPTCGDALADREAEDPVTIGDVTTRWVCN